MFDVSDIILAVKCAPQEEILSNIDKAGIRAVELYLTDEMLTEIQKIVKLCKNFSFKYFLHASNHGFNLLDLSRLANEIKVRILVFHNIYWEDEWEEIIRVFKDVDVKLCVENTYSVHEPLKFMRRFGIGRCLDLEHLQMQCAGVYEEEFIRPIQEAAHIHLTGYVYGSELWHTHIHHSPEHGQYMLDLLNKCNYSGLVISEAKASLQTYTEFKALGEFYKRWKDKVSKAKLVKKDKVVL